MFRVLCLLAVLLLSSMATTAQAAPPPWPNTSYAYHATGESIRQVLETFGRSFGVRTQVSPAVSGTIEGRFFADTPSAFLDRLSMAYGLTWHYHAGVLHIHSAAETVNRPIEVPNEDLATVRDALLGLGVLDERFGWGEFPDRGAVMVSGPPSYVDLVERTLRNLPSGRSPGMTLSVFRLRHATVDDRTFTYRDRQVTVPGVAAVLRNLVTNQSLAGTGTRTEPLTTVAPASRGGILGSGVPPLIVQPEGQAGNGEGGQAQAVHRDASTESPVIQADTRLNAVIIKDRAERMPAYQALIELLDVPTALIEIEATVIDVNTSRVEELGIRWQGRSGNFAGGFGTIDSAQPSDRAISIGTANNANLQTILSGTGAFFLARISALEEVGDASILSRPSVLTLDNLQAVLDLSETFYIRLEGERVADVVPVSAGVMLRVTPRMIADTSGHRIQLAVDIEDGTIMREQTVSNIPTVRRSTISTQAVIGSEESLLIGGYYYETGVDSVEKVPLLGDIPVLGLLFSRTAKEAQKRERLFMITPRLIEVPGQ
ncbi:type III secretion system outer membrane ring subunit SctC [Telmatospirillum sp. J64-1]|uniref:type III secretion system outer membrane ring subunit SctC n=1 Tax=Telmatospirillum sp. J64-1 TaxID=2502183 RepID=UPI00115E1D86|nr:type III secretion system outer membrane ring subunit SctC [Telmatospirillum sp. J64-1]